MPRHFYKRTLTVVLMAICVGLGYAGFQATLRRNWASDQLHASQDTLDDQTRANDRLAADVARLQSPAWLALVARAQLNYKRPDESVVYVYRSDPPTVATQAAATPVPLSNWRRWTDWLRLTR